MKFKVENNWLVRTEEDIELNPKDFLYCANFAELQDELEDKIHSVMKCPKMEDGYVLYEESLGTYFWDTTYGKFVLEWQRLKGLPQEL